MKYPKPAERRKRAQRVANTRWLQPTRGLKLTRQRVASAWLDGYESCMRDVAKANARAKRPGELTQCDGPDSYE